MARRRLLRLSITGDHVLRTYCPLTRSAPRGESHAEAGESAGPDPRESGALLRGASFAAEVGLKLVYADGGRAAVTLPVRVEGPDEDGTVHRSAITALVEAAAGAAALSCDQNGGGPGDISITFVRDAPQRPLVAEARMLAHEGPVRSCEVDVSDWNGALVAKGFLTYGS
ncbi:MAG: PaaI family thioesterase [Thermoleophilaceae bacterium]